MKKHDKQYINNTLNLINYSFDLINSKSNWKIKIQYKENTIGNFDLAIYNWKKYFSKNNISFDDFCNYCSDFIEFYYLIKNK